MKKNLYFLFLACSTGYAQNIDSLAKLRVDWEDTPGIVVAFYANGKTQYYAHGFANKETKVKTDPKTLFEIGSITKTFTCLLTATMVEKKRFALDDPIQKFFPPEVRVPELNKKQITVENLATQRSGLPRMPGNFFPASPQNPFIDYTKKEMFNFLNGYVLPREPGSQYEYSNLGIGLLAVAICNPKTYSEQVESVITDPLGMDQTILNTPGSHPNQAQGYNGGVPVSAWTWTSETAMAGAGGLLSNAEDMMKYIIANMNEAGPLGPAMAMTHKARHDAGAGMEIGLGWHIKSSHIIWHNGGTAGFRTFAGFHAQNKTGVVVLTNSNTGADDLGFYLLDHSLPLKAPIKTTTVDIKTLERYVGEYEMNPQFKITVFIKDGIFYGQATGQNAFQLFALSPNRFHLKVIEAEVEFVSDAKGVVEKLVLYQNGAVQPAKKVK